MKLKNVSVQHTGICSELGAFDLLKSCEKYDIQE